MQAFYTFGRLIQVPVFSSIVSPVNDPELLRTQVKRENGSFSNVDSCFFLRFIILYCKISSCASWDSTRLFHLLFTGAFEPMSFNLLSLQSLLCCLAFFFAGIIDAVCGGGGLITIPTMLAVGIPVHFITGTNQCSAWLGSGVAAYDYIKSGNFHFKSALITLPFSMLGSFIGAKLNLMVPEHYLKMFMIISVPLISIFIFTNKKLGETDSVDEKSDFSILLWSAVIGLVLGAYQGFYGPGGGLFFMLAYAAFLKLSLVRATGNTRFVVAVSSITSVLTYAVSGTVIWNLALANTVFYMIGSHLGAKIAIRNGVKVIRPVMLCMIVLLFAKLVSDLL